MCAYCIEQVRVPLQLSALSVIPQELGADPVGDITNFVAEPGYGMKCTVKGIEAFAKQTAGRRNESSAIISRYRLCMGTYLHRYKQLYEVSTFVMVIIVLTLEISHSTIVRMSKL